MKISQTPLGEVRLGQQVELFEAFAEMIQATVANTNYPPGVALTGGSSPKAFFKWLVENPGKLPEAKDSIVFTVSDERYVPIDSEESNYGNAERLFFDSVGVEIDNRFPWDTSRIAPECAEWYAQLWSFSFGENHAYDICMLGMGDDCHTASLFPGSPLLTDEAMAQGESLFASVDVPEKGTRLTITPKGFSKCKKIAVFVFGEAKADALAKVFSIDDGATVSEVPIRVLKEHADRVIWFVDDEAASKLKLD